MTYLVKKKIKGQTYYYEYESYRAGGKVKHRCVHYLGKSKNLRKKGDIPGHADITVHSSVDYGSVVSLYTLAERIHLSEIVYNAAKKGGGEHIGKLVEIMVINRCIEPVSRNKLRDWYEKTALPIFLGIPPDKVHPQIFYNAMNYLTDKTILRIQKELFQTVRRIYGIETSTIFYDLTSTYFEGMKCPLGEFGHSTDNRPDKLQINIGMGVDKDCIPITHDVYPGSVKDVTTVQSFVEKLKTEFGLENPIMVIDRGMISEENLDQLIELGYDYIVARKLGPLESKIVYSVPDTEYVRTMLSNYSEDRELWLGETRVDGKRWIICWNKNKAEDDKAFRETMIAKTIQGLEKVEKGCGKRHLKTKEQVYHKAYTVLEKYKTKRFFNININEHGAPRLKFELIDKEMEKADWLDGKYILETSSRNLLAVDIAQVYHDRDTIEKFFQTLKDIVELRPTYVYTERHVKAHIFICILAVLLLSLIKKILKESGTVLSSIKALEILDGIKRVEFSLNSGKGTIVRTTKINDQQREIISILNVAPIGL
jgi:transposase